LLEGLIVGSITAAHSLEKHKRDFLWNSRVIEISASISDERYN
jgi:hypothetical protein